MSHSPLTLARSHANKQVARNHIDPGRARTANVFGAVRDRYIQADRFRPCNRVRQPSEKSDIRQRALMLANKLPFHTRFNFLRS